MIKNLVEKPVALKPEFPLYWSIVRDNVPETFAQSGLLSHIHIIRSKQEIVRLLLEKWEIRKNDFLRLSKEHSISIEKKHITPHKEVLSKLTDIQEVIENIKYFCALNQNGVKLNEWDALYISDLQQFIQKNLTARRMSQNDFLKAVSEKRERLGSFHRGVFLHNTTLPKEL